MAVSFNQNFILAASVRKLYTSGIIQTSTIWVHAFARTTSTVRWKWWTHQRKRNAMGSNGYSFSLPTPGLRASFQFCVNHTDIAVFMLAYILAIAHKPVVNTYSFHHLQWTPLHYAIHTRNLPLSCSNFYHSILRYTCYPTGPTIWTCLFLKSYRPPWLTLDIYNVWAADAEMCVVKNMTAGDRWADISCHCIRHDLHTIK